MIRGLPPARRPRTVAARPGFEALEGRRLLASLLVTNTLDSGPGSLRQAILDENANPEFPTIAFQIPGSGVHTIALDSALPAIMYSTDIDATTQPGYSGSPLVAIDGTNAGIVPGLSFGGLAGGSTIRGLAIERFLADGIDDSVDGLTIQADEIGIDPATGSVAANQAGILVSASNTLIGGPTAADGNVISGNVQEGVGVLDSTNTTISHNLIGTDATGRTDIGNIGPGVLIGNALATTIDTNTISNNGGPGVVPGPQGTVLTNNTITNNSNASLLTNLALVASSTTVVTSTGKVEQLTYTVTNQGPNPATDVRFTLSSEFASLPGSGADQQVVKLAGAIASQGAIAPGASLTSISTPFDSPGFANLGTLAPGATASVTVALSVVGSGTDSLDAAAVADQSSNTGPPFFQTTTIQSVGAADISVKSLPPEPAKVGSPVILSFVITNNDPQYAAFVSLALNTAQTPGATLQSFDAGSSSFFGPPNEVLGQPGLYEDQAIYAVPAGASITLNVGLTTAQPGAVIASLAASSSSDVDPDPANNLALAGTVPAYDPTVTAASLRPATGSIQSVVVGFDSPMNVSQAQDVRNYHLSTADQKAGITIRSAGYNATNRGVTLLLSKALPRVGTPITLVVGGPGTPGLTATDGSELLGGIYTTTLTRG